jgi:hypothetical protein
METEEQEANNDEEAEEMDEPENAEACSSAPLVTRESLADGAPAPASSS